MPNSTEFVQIQLRWLGQVQFKKTPSAECRVIAVFCEGAISRYAAGNPASTLAKTARGL
ncbi:hypothetical protein AB3R30_08775 [Leptolyngbyaceae cyanobacterium UHCC 1019]